MLWLPFCCIAFYCITFCCIEFYWIIFYCIRFCRAESFFVSCIRSTGMLIIKMIAVQKLILHMPQLIGQIYMNLMRIHKTAGFIPESI